MSTRKGMFSRKVMVVTAACIALALVSLAILPSGFAHIDHTTFVHRGFGVEVGMTQTQARAALLNDRRFRYAGMQACQNDRQSDESGCADATRIDMYKAHGLLAEGWVNLGIRDDRVVYIYADKRRAA